MVRDVQLQKLYIVVFIVFVNKLIVMVPSFRGRSKEEEEEKKEQKVSFKMPPLVRFLHTDD